MNYPKTGNEVCISLAISNTMLSGIGKGTITREEAMALIYRTLEKVNWTLTREVDTAYSSFKDTASVSSYAVSCMQYFVKTGVVVGSAGKLNPKAAISRAEMAVTLHRVLTY